MADEMDSSEWEEIDPQEVEMIISVIDGLIEGIKTETLVAHLQEVQEKIESLVDWEDDDQADAA